MDLLKLWVSVIVIFINLDRYDGANQDYCNGEHFKAQCADNELIIMDSALYGRMRTGECMPNHLDYLGCRSDVMAHFDARCSARQACDVLVTDRDVPSGEECIEGYVRYLEASYSCKNALSVNGVQCSNSKHPIVQVRASQIYISRDTILNSCIQPNRTWTLSASKGQYLNISLVNFGPSSKQTHEEIYGSLKQADTPDKVVFGSGERFQHIMVTGGHSVEVVLLATRNNEGKYLLDVTVLGCANLSPPEGSWVSRDGDVTQVGCHSSDKVWTLRCGNNQWVGAVGQCGTAMVYASVREGGQDSEMGGVSINVLVFGVCSAVVFISAIAFLIGVCVLKRRPPEPLYMLPPDQDGFTLQRHKMPIPQIYNPPDVTSCTCDVINDLPNVHGNHTMPRIHHTNDDPLYNSVRLSHPTYATYDGARSARSTVSRKTMEYSQYMKSDASDRSESVKYFVLENNVG